MATLTALPTTATLLQWSAPVATPATQVATPAMSDTATTAARPTTVQTLAAEQFVRWFEPTTAARSAQTIAALFAQTIAVQHRPTPVALLLHTPDVQALALHQLLA